jgi:hypothetical protein
VDLLKCKRLIVSHFDLPSGKPNKEEALFAALRNLPTDPKFRDTLKQLRGPSGWFCGRERRALDLRRSRRHLARLLQTPEEPASLQTFEP